MSIAAGTTSASEAATKYELRVGAHVLIQLGSELVTDVEQAILECVKNAYDADSTGCKIEVATSEMGERVEIGLASDLEPFDGGADEVAVSIRRIEDTVQDGPHAPQGVRCERRLSYRGRLTIEDNGDGMTADQLRESWLVISSSKKRGALGQSKRKTVKGRTPLGDKGLGRLGTMKLGDILLVETATSADANLATAQFRWADCQRAHTVDQIPVRFESLPNVARFKGTKVSVLGLNELHEWSRPGRVNEIANSLARLVSPFEAVSTFPVIVQVDAETRSLVSVTNDILSRAVASFDFSWEADKDGNMELKATARLQKKLLAPTRTDEQRMKARLVFGEGNEEKFLETLRAPSRFKGYTRKSFGETGKWYVELERRIPWSDMVLDSGAAIEDPGPFTGSFYFFHLTKKDDQDAAALSGYGVSSALIKDLTGVAILRDGFRVRSQGDWLGLSSEMTSGSTYGLRVDNTIGYFLLTGEKNGRLVEKSDREGFVEDAAYRGFQQIARRCAAYASDAMIVVRRSFDQFARKQQEAGKEHLAVPGAPIKAVEDGLRIAESVRTRAALSVVDLRRDIHKLESELTEGAPPDHSLERAIAIAKNANTAMERVAGELVAERLDAVSFLRRELDDQRTQIESLFDSAAIGLSARGLVHELRTHLGEIRQRSSALANTAKANGNAQGVDAHLRAIRGACDAITSAASLINPMLPRSRTLRQTFKLSEFLKDYFESRALTLEHAGIGFEITSGPNQPSVRVNSPRLLQVVDNLVNNSRYWLKRGKLTGETSRDSAIKVEVFEGGFILSDTGPGVALDLEDRLFDVFVTGRADSGEGQGLGLYIVSNLLSLDGCSISLHPERNDLGRRYKFVVDLSNVIVK